MPDALYVRTGKGSEPTDATIGPWSRDALESFAALTAINTDLTIDLSRVPIGE